MLYNYSQLITITRVYYLFKGARRYLHLCTCVQSREGVAAAFCKSIDLYEAIHTERNAVSSRLPKRTHVLRCERNAAAQRQSDMYYFTWINSNQRSGLRQFERNAF